MDSAAIQQQRGTHAPPPQQPTQMSYVDQQQQYRMMQQHQIQQQQMQQQQMQHQHMQQQQMHLQLQQQNVNMQPQQQLPPQLQIQQRTVQQQPQPMQQMLPQQMNAPRMGPLVPRAPYTSQPPQFAGRLPGPGHMMAMPPPLIPPQQHQYASRPVLASYMPQQGLARPMLVKQSVDLSNHPQELMRRQSESRPASAEAPIYSGGVPSMETSGGNGTNYQQGQATLQRSETPNNGYQQTSQYNYPPPAVPVYAPQQIPNQFAGARIMMPIPPYQMTQSGQFLIRNPHMTSQPMQQMQVQNMTPQQQYAVQMQQQHMQQQHMQQQQHERMIQMQQQQQQDMLQQQQQQQQEQNHQEDDKQTPSGPVYYNTQTIRGANPSKLWVPQSTSAAPLAAAYPQGNPDVQGPWLRQPGPPVSYTTEVQVPEVQQWRQPTPTVYAAQAVQGNWIPPHGAAGYTNEMPTGQHQYRPTLGAVPGAWPASATSAAISGSELAAKVAATQKRKLTTNSIKIVDPKTQQAVSFETSSAADSSSEIQPGKRGIKIEAPSAETEENGRKLDTSVISSNVEDASSFTVSYNGTETDEYSLQSRSTSEDAEGVKDEAAQSRRTSGDGEDVKGVAVSVVSNTDVQPSTVTTPIDKLTSVTVAPGVPVIDTVVRRDSATQALDVVEEESGLVMKINGETSGQEHDVSKEPLVPECVQPTDITEPKGSLKIASNKEEVSTKPDKVEDAINVQPESRLNAESKKDNEVIESRAVDASVDLDTKHVAQVKEPTMTEVIETPVEFVRNESTNSLTSDVGSVETASSTDAAVTASSTLPEVLVVDSLTTSITSSTSDDSTAAATSLPAAELKTTVIEPTVINVDETEKKTESTIEETPKSTKPSALKLKYDYKPDQWSPVNPTGSRKYDRTFLLQMKFSQECAVKPLGLPDLPDVILDSPLSVDSPQPMMMSQSASYPSIHDFTPNYAGQHYTKSSGSMQRGMQGGMASGGGGAMRGGRDGGPGGHGGGNSGGGQGGRGGSNMPRIDMQQPAHRVIESFNRSVQLNKSDNAWKPTAATGSKVPDTLDPEQAKTEVLYKQVRSILNKITPQKLDMLIDKVIALQIDTEDRLKGVIDILFEKAISEPSFCPAYAKLAHRMISLKVPTITGELVSFRKLLINRCQTEFEKDVEDELDSKRRQSEIDATTKEEEKKRLTEDMQAASVVSRRRSLGNVRFIAELFKLKMLTENIMHDCISKLIKSSDEDSLECLSRLLINIGKDLSNNVRMMESYFVSIKQMTRDKKKYSARIRFMLQDVTELRENKWVPRRADNNPKTIEQIHSEAQSEKQEKEMMIRNLPNMPPQSNMGRPPNRGGGGGGGGKPPSNDDGWTSVGVRPRDNKVDPTRILKLVGTKTMDENVTLGPGQRPGGNWAFGSRGGGVSRSQESDHMPPPPSNRYAALDTREGGGSGGGRQSNTSTRGRSFPPRGGQDEQKFPASSFSRNAPRFDTPYSSSSRSGSRESSQVRENLRGSRDNLGGSKDNLRDDRLGASTSIERDTPTPPRVDSPIGSRTGSLYASPRDGSLAGSGESSRGPTPPLAQASVEPLPVIPPPENMLTEDGLPVNISLKVVGMIGEYLSLKDLQEASLRMEELKLSTIFLTATVSCILNHVLEKTRNQTDRKLIAVLFGKFLEREKILTTSNFLKGLKDVVTFVPDLICDIPKAWEYISDILCPLILSHVVQLKQVSEACAELENSKDGAVLLAHTMQRCALEQGNDRSQQLWLESGLSWTQFMSPADVDSFLAAMCPALLSNTSTSEAREISTDNNSSRSTDNTDITNRSELQQQDAAYRS